MYTRTIRAPTQAEAAGLRRRFGVQARHGPTARRMALVALGLCGGLWVLTMLATRLLLWPTVAWAAFALVLTAWSWWEERRRRAAQRRRLEGALTGGRVEEVTVASIAVVELQEVEDLGPIWAFQVAPTEMLVVANHQDLPRGFPTADFTRTTFLDGAGEAIDVTWALRGARLRPVRTITVETQRAMRRPDDLEHLAGRLDDLERLLGGSVRDQPGSVEHWTRGPRARTALQMATMRT